MKKVLKFTGIIVLFLLLFYVGSLYADKQTLRNEVIRLHVVADSNSSEDQQIKLHVRDAILAFLEKDIGNYQTTQEVKEYLATEIPTLEATAEEVLKKFGANDPVKISLTKEKFDVRKYDTFTLPSGVYDSLRVEIGSAKGKNWWCVVFPALCVPTTQDAFADTAVSAGFNQDLTNTLSGNDGYQVRFFFLDCLGKLENFFSFS